MFAGLPDRTYGTPTSLPWAVDLGDGVGRHPVQVYESASMALFLAAWLAGLTVFWWRAGCLLKLIARAHPLWLS